MARPSHRIGSHSTLLEVLPIIYHLIGLVSAILKVIKVLVRLCCYGMHHLWTRLKNRLFWTCTAFLICVSLHAACLAYTYEPNTATQKAMIISQFLISFPFNNEDETHELYAERARHIRNPKTTQGSFFEACRFLLCCWMRGDACVVIPLYDLCIWIMAVGSAQLLRLVTGQDGHQHYARQADLKEQEERKPFINYNEIEPYFLSRQTGLPPPHIGL